MSPKDRQDQIKKLRKNKSTMTLVCLQKGFAQLFLVTALCMHRQVCQCYAGNGISNGVIHNHSPIIGKQSRSSFQPLQPRAKLNKRNDHEKRIGDSSSMLYQSTVTTTVGDEGDDTRDECNDSLSIRGGSDNAAIQMNAHNLTNTLHNNQSTISSIADESPNLTIEDGAQTANKELEVETTEQRKWPCGDVLDKQLIKIALPCIANFAINPLVGAVDLFWINRMGNTLAVAGQAAANQIFSSSFWVISFLPSGKKKILL